LLNIYDVELPNQLNLIVLLNFHLIMLIVNY